MSEPRPRLFTPGPVEVPPELSEAAGFVVHHRSALFREIFADVRAALRRFFGTVGEVAVLASSGTGAMEAAVANLVSPGDPVLVVRSGKYGNRWGEICRAYGARVEWLDLEPGVSAEPDRVRRAVEEGEPRVVFVVHSETSTGALQDVEGIARAAAGRAIVGVDAVSSLGVHAIRMDFWGVDVAVGASQKGLGLAPGLGFVAVGPAALRRLDGSASPRYYFDLRRYVSTALGDETPWTAPVGQIAALRSALRRAGTPEEHVRRHARLGSAARAGVRALGLELFPVTPSDGVTVFRVPEGLDAERLVDRLEEEHGIRIAHGQGDLRGRILRLGHMGWIADPDLVGLFGALESALAICGFRVEEGKGVRAVRSVLENSGLEARDGT